LMKNKIHFLLLVVTSLSINAQTSPNIPFVRLSESNDPDTIEEGIACFTNSTNEYHDNSFYRFYDLQRYVDSNIIDPGTFMVTNLEFAQSAAEVETLLTYFVGTIDRNDYFDDYYGYDAFPNSIIDLSHLTILASGNHVARSSDNNSLVNIPISPLTFNTDEVVYYAILVGSGELDSHFFSMGGNTLGGSLSYFNSSGTCDLNDINDSDPNSTSHVTLVIPGSGGFFRTIMNIYGISNPSAIGLPTNDTCETAETLIVGTSFEDNPMDFTTLNATQDGGGCNNGSALPVSNEIWVRTTIPPEGHLVVETGPDVLTGNTNFVSGMDAWLGSSCDNLTQLPGCGISNYSLHDFSSIIIEGTPGETVYVRVFGNFVVPFSVSAYNPPVPTNMICENAESLTVGATFDDQNVDSSFLWTDINGLWFSFIAPLDGNVTIETGPDSTGLIAANTSIAVVSGSCTNFAFIGSDLNSGNFNFSRLDLTGLTPGESYFVIVNDAFSTFRAPFSVSVYNETLGIDETAFNNFDYYPNPVGQTLNFDTTEHMDQVTVYNLLGQEMMNLRSKDSTSITTMNFSGLSNGIYLVKISIGNQFKVIKVVKE
ncbi:MAG: T9SS type A sorting domain-containing protein, partial [Bacteroidota bacterium]